jgi:hypothetical protein
VTRILLLLLGMLTTGRQSAAPAARYRPAPALGQTRDPNAAPLPPDEDGRTADPPDWPSRSRGREDRQVPAVEQPEPGDQPSRRRRILRRAALIGGIVLAGLIFRKVVAFLVLTALSAALHLVGLNVHLPTIKFGWPWQTISAGTTSNTDLGPWVLQRIEGISKPALGRASFTFDFTHKVSKSIGPWPCWYQSTFYAVAYASATVDLNPGPSWWAPATGHYQLQVLARPVPGKPGQVTVAMVLPQPQLPQSVHDVTIDNIPSKPIDTQHSWTYPGFGCGVLLKPQFPESVLYAQAQQIAFDKADHSPQITRPLIAAAEAQASETIRDNFIQPTVNAFGYTLTQFTLSWVAS